MILAHVAAEVKRGGCEGEGGTGQATGKKVTSTALVAGVASGVITFQLATVRSRATMIGGAIMCIASCVVVGLDRSAKHIKG